MSEKNPNFFNPEKDDANPKDDKLQPKTSIVSDTPVENIDISHISGPLVVFFGPRNIGKTVSLLRLSSFISGKFRVTPVENFRDDEQYEKATQKFEEIRNNVELAPDATGVINFLLLNIGPTSGGTFCQILEAPGEHFFEPDDPTRRYPPYLLKIFNSESYRKVYVFFFSIGMFGKEKQNKQYADKIAKLVSTKIDSKRDKVIILCNKCDEQYAWFKNKKPIERRFRKELYGNPSFSPLVNLLRESGFKHIHFIPFSAGEFTEYERLGKKEKALTPSPNFYPKKLWDAIYDCIKGGWRFRLF